MGNVGKLKVNNFTDYNQGLQHFKVLIVMPYNPIVI